MSPEELIRLDALLDDLAFLHRLCCFGLRMESAVTPMETYPRMMFLKFRYRLGYDSLCREVADSITWPANLANNQDQGNKMRPGLGPLPPKVKVSGRSS